jgi:hypothetical protein
MATTTEEARLILSAEDKGFDDARKKVEQLERDLVDLQARYKSGAVGVDEYRQAGLRLQGQLDDERAALTKAEQALKQHGSAAAASKALGDAAQSSRNLGQAALETSRALEDLQYGVAGVVNNIPSLTMALGGSAGLTAAISLTAVGINQLIKHWDDIIALFEHRNPFPKAADAVTGLKKELEKAGDQMKELEKRTSLTDAQLSEFNALREKTAKLEKQIADETERQKQLKELHEAPTPTAKGYQEAYEKGVVATGEGGRFHADLDAALAEQDKYVQVLVDKLTATAADIEKLDIEPQKRATMLDAAREEYARGIQAVAHNAKDRANELIQQLAKGNEDAFNTVREVVKRAGPGRFGDRIRQGLAHEDPRNKQAAALEEQGAALEAEARRELAQIRTERTRQAARETGFGVPGAGVTPPKGALGAERGGVGAQEGALRLDQGIAETAKAEAARISDILGPEFQGQFEASIARNRLAQAQGAPVARMGAEARQYEGAGMPYAVPEASLAANMQRQMAQTFERRGASPEGARQAATDIGGRAQLDVARRAEAISATGASTIQQTLELTREIIASYSKQNAALNAAQHEIGRQRADLARANNATQRTAQAQWGRR